MNKVAVAYLCAAAAIVGVLLWIAIELDAIRYLLRGVSVQLFNLPRDLGQR